MKKNYKRSDLNIINEKNYNMLSFEKDYFIPIKNHVMSQENIQIEYEIIGEKLDEVNFVSYEKLEIIYKLLEIVEEEQDTCEYALDPSNIYVDFVGNVRIFERKVMQDPISFESRKIKEIKALLGYLYLNKNYEKLINTNNKSILKNKKVVKFMNGQTIQELKLVLKEMIDKEKKRFVSTKKVVNAKRYRNLSRNKNGYRIFLLLFLVIILIAFIYIIPFKNLEIAGYTSYIENDYTKVLKTYSEVNIKRMTKHDKYIFTISTIKTQTQINNNQKNKVLANIDMKTNDNILDYWVYIGQGNFEEANNKAVIINDVDMQIYALLLLIDKTQNDPDLSVEDRQSSLSSYEGQVDSLKKAKEDLNAEEEAKENKNTDGS